MHYHKGILMAQQNTIPQSACICINLRRIAAKVTDFYDKALKPAGVTINQYSLLINISRMEGCGTGALARLVGLERSTLVRTLSPLLNAGLIEDKSPAQIRKRALYLTASGHDTLKTGLPLWEKAQHDIFSKFGDGYESFMDTFHKIATLE